MWAWFGFAKHLILIVCFACYKNGCREKNIQITHVWFWQFVCYNLCELCWHECCHSNSYDNLCCNHVFTREDKPTCCAKGWWLFAWLNQTWLGGSTLSSISKKLGPKHPLMDLAIGLNNGPKLEIFFLKLGVIFSQVGTNNIRWESGATLGPLLIFRTLDSGLSVTSMGAYFVPAQHDCLNLKLLWSWTLK